MSVLSRIAEIVRHTDTAYLDEHWSWDTSPDQIAQELYDAVRAEVLAEAANAAGELAEEFRGSGGEMAEDREWGAAQVAQNLFRMADEAGKDTHPGESTQPAELTVYRAVHADGDHLGTYTTRDAARQRCAAVAEREEPYVTSADWHSEEDDGDGGPESLTVVVGGHQVETGYLVIPVSVATAYDPDADE